MRVIITSLAMTALTMPAGAMFADQLRTSLRVHVRTHSYDAVDARTPHRVVFTGRPVTAEVHLSAASFPDGSGAAAKSVKLPSPQWWNNVTWHLTKEGDASQVRIDAESFHQRLDDGEPRPVTMLQAGQRATAAFRVTTLLDPGAYRLHVRLGDLRSDDEWFLVSTGSENQNLRAAYARYKLAYESHDPVTRRASLLEVAQHDPLDASPWLKLGDMVLENGTVQEITTYYNRALDVLGARERMFKERGETFNADAVSQYASTVSNVLQLIPGYVKQRKTLALVPAGDCCYILKDRRTGRVVRSIGKPTPSLR